MANGFIGQINIGSDQHLIGSTLFAISSTAASEGAKIAALQSSAVYTATTGITIHVQFEHGNTVTAGSSLTLKVGNDTAHPIVNPNGALTWNDNSIISFTYDGTNWVINSSGIDANSTSLALGNISSNGTLTNIAATIATGDYLVITDASDNGGRIAKANVSFDTTKTDYFLSQKGNWAQIEWGNINSKPTTISEYGITDAKITNGKITLGSNEITPITSVNGHSGSSVTVTAGDLGLSAALRFIGTTTSNISDGWTGVPAGITNYTTPIVGDVVLKGDEEYVCISITGTGSNTTYTWELLGKDSSFALDNAVIHNNLLTTTGDIIYRSSTAPTRLGIGTTGQVLTVSDGVPVWADNQATDNKVAQVLDTSSNNYALLFSDNQTSTTTATITTGAKRNNSIYVTPSAGSITATKFIGALEGTLRTSDVKSALGTGTESGLVFLHKSGDWKTLQITNTTTTIASVSNGVLTLMTSVKENATLGIAT